MKTLLTILLIIISLSSYSQTVANVKKDHIVLNEGYDEDGDYYLFVDGDEIFDYKSFYFKNRYTTSYLMIGVLNLSKVIPTIQYFNNTFITLSRLVWINLDRNIKIKMEIYDEYALVEFTHL